MIVDASVASHWFADTEFSHAADKFREFSNLIAPTFLLVETANVLYKRARAGEIRPERCAESIDVLKAAMAELVPDAEVLPQAVELALQRQHPVYDCLYLALAVARNDTLVTADKRLAGAAQALNIQTELIKPAS